MANMITQETCDQKQDNQKNHLSLPNRTEFQCGFIALILGDKAKELSWTRRAPMRRHK